MPSEKRGRRPEALVLSARDERDARAFALGPRLAASGSIASRRVAGARDLEGLPPARVLFLDLPEADAALVDALAALRRRRSAEWYALARRGEAASLWRLYEGLVEGVLEAPLGEGVVEALVAGQRRGREAEAERKRALADEARAARRLALLSDTVRAAGSLLDPGMVARFTMTRASRMLGAQRFRLYRADEAAGVLRLVEQRDAEGARPPAATIPLGAGIAGWVARSRCVLQLEDLEHDLRLDREREWPEPPECLLAAPLVSRGRVIGVVEFADPQSGRFAADDRALVETCLEPAAIALDNASLFRRLEEQTVTDDLTELYNARFMENYLRRETKRANRYGHPVALLFLDLDGFKQVNDVHGHMAGSRTLVEVGAVLRRNLRDIDVVARWGGDEFTVVLPETDAPGAMEVAERVVRTVRMTPFLRELGLEVSLSASIGVAAWPTHGRSAEALLSAADSAMYAVKNSGKDGARFAAPSEAGEEREGAEDEPSSEARREPPVEEGAELAGKS